MSKVEIFKYDKDQTIWGRHYLELARELTVDDYDVDENWRLPGKFDDIYSPTEPTAWVFLKLKQNVYDHIHKVSNPEDRWNEGVLNADNYHNKEITTYINSAKICRVISFKGVRKASQKKKYDAAVAEIMAELGDPECVRAALAISVASDNERINTWMARSNNNYLSDGERAALQSGDDTMRKEAGVVPLDDEITTARAQLDKLYAERRAKWKAHIRKTWEDDTRYPALLRARVLESIDEGNLNSGPGRHRL